MDIPNEHIPEQVAPPNEPTPLEEYQFVFTEEEYDSLYTTQRKKLLSSLPFAVFVALFALLASLLNQSSFLLGVAMVFTLFCTVIYILALKNIRKVQNAGKDDFLAAVYTYRTYSNYLIVITHRHEEKMGEVRIYYDKLQNMYESHGLVVFQFNNKLYPVRAAALTPTSFFRVYLAAQQSTKKNKKK
ncbi:MAG: hypothetical protein IJW40_10275 [Clostridia bacterium]|nr:hypothetical protein [Clostridia bacterium]